MRRAVLTLSGTVAGLAALFSFRTHVPGVTPVALPSTPAGLSVSAAPRTPGTSPSPSASPSKTVKKTAPKASSSPTAPAMTTPTTPSAPASTPAMTVPTTAPPSVAPTKAPKPTPTPTPTATKSTAPAAPSGTFTGTDESTNYGPVQVQITVSGGKITAASDVQATEDSIGAGAVSPLNSEVLTAQSASVQGVSGATYTSDGYIASLQAAVDQAGL
jgi:uncharacterized protein with FMN-binding domain